MEDKFGSYADIILPSNKINKPDYYVTSNTWMLISGTCRESMQRITRGTMHFISVETKRWLEQRRDGAAGNTIPCNNNKRSRYPLVHFPFLSSPFCVDRSRCRGGGKKSRREIILYRGIPKRNRAGASKSRRARCNEPTTVCRRCMRRATGQGVDRSDIKLLAIIIHQRDACPRGRPRPLESRVRRRGERVEAGRQTDVFAYVNI